VAGAAWWLGRTDAGDARGHQGAGGGAGWHQCGGSLDAMSCINWCAGTLSATGGCQAAGPIADGVFNLLGAAVLVGELVLLVQRGRARSGPLRGQ
jgi:hypothetical protein